MHLSKLKPRVQVRWITNGFWSVLDQGLISGSNFVISIVLARWLNADQYGAFALGLALFLLVLIAYQCLLLEPMAVYGGATCRPTLRGYLVSVVRLHRLGAGFVFLLLLVSAAVASSHNVALAGVLAGTAIASPFMLLLSLARRSLYLLPRPREAAFGSVVYFVLSLSLFFVARLLGVISPFTAFLAMGAAAAIPGIYLMRRVRGLLPADTSVLPEEKVARMHWSYGKWAVASAIASWVPAYIYFPLLSQFSGLAQAGSLRALINLAAPMTQLQAAFSMLLLPYAARCSRQPERREVRSLGIRLSVASLFAAAFYWTLILTFHGPLFRALYSGKYDSAERYLGLVAVGSVLWAGTFGFSLALRAMEYPKFAFAANAAAALASLFAGVPATWLYGLSGAIWGINISDGIALVILAVLLLLATRKGFARPSAIEFDPMSDVEMVENDPAPVNVCS